MCIDNKSKIFFLFELMHFLIYSQIAPVPVTILMVQTLFDTFRIEQFPILLNSLQCNYFYQGFYLTKYFTFANLSSFWLMYLCVLACYRLGSLLCTAKCLNNFICQKKKIQMHFCLHLWRWILPNSLLFIFSSEAFESLQKL